jgi:hypothetical protein
LQRRYVQLLANTLGNVFPPWRRSDLADPECDDCRSRDHTGGAAGDDHDGRHDHRGSANYNSSDTDRAHDHRRVDHNALEDVRSELHLRAPVVGR